MIAAVANTMITGNAIRNTPKSRISIAAERSPVIKTTRKMPSGGGFPK